MAKSKQELQAAALRKANEGLGDIEFASDIQQMVGPGYPTVDPSRARMQSFGVPSNLGGYNVPEDYEVTEEDKDRYRLNGVSLPLEPNTVNAVEPYFDKSTWAHEYRHDTIRGDERGNRKKDAMFAKSKKEWQSAVESLRGSREKPTTNRALELKAIMDIKRNQAYYDIEDPVNRYWQKREKELTENGLSIEEQLAIQEEVLQELAGRD